MATETHRDHITPEPDSVVSKAALQLRQFMCGLHGHDTLMHFSQGRISLLCSSCGYETPGWEVKAQVRRNAVERKPQAAPMTLAQERRVA